MIKVYPSNSTKQHKSFQFPPMYNSFRTQKHQRVSTKSNASTQLKHKQSFGFFEACLHSCFFKADNNSLLRD